MRLRDPGISREVVRRLWEQSELVNELEDGQERYNKELDVLFIERGGVIKTVLKGDMLGTVVKTRPCRWCGKNRLGNDECLKCCGRLCKDVVV